MKGKIKKNIKNYTRQKNANNKTPKAEPDQTKPNQTKEKRFHFNISYCRAIFGAFLRQ